MYCNKCKEEVYPDGIPLTQEEKVAARKRWDARYEAALKKVYPDARYEAALKKKEKK